MTELIDVIATAIGYHFWNVDSDNAARRCGLDAAIDVYKAIQEWQDTKLESSLAKNHETQQVERS